MGGAQTKPSLPLYRVQNIKQGVQSDKAENVQCRIFFYVQIVTNSMVFELVAIQAHVIFWGPWVHFFIYSLRHKLMREFFFIILYPYFTLKGLIFMLEVKFHLFLAEPTHMPDLSSEQFDITPKEGSLKIVSIKHDFYLIQPYSNLNKI